LASSTEPARQRYIAELDELRLQVEVMFVRVDENLERMRQVLETGDVALADVAIAADDEIDAMNLSLTERCYDVLAREGPVASDLRLVVSVIRILNELERVGDLALRVIKLAPDMELLRAVAAAGLPAASMICCSRSVIESLLPDQASAIKKTAWRCGSTRPLVLRWVRLRGSAADVAGRVVH
jgi:phosphate transport system protein